MCPTFDCMRPGRRGQKRHAQSALVRCASLHVSRSSDGNDVHHAVRKNKHIGRAVRKDRHIGLQPNTDADAPSCRQERQTRWHATNYRYGCNIGPSMKTDALACNELPMLMRHRAVRKDKHVGACRHKRQTRCRATNYGC